MGTYLHFRKRMPAMFLDFASKMPLLGGWGKNARPIILEKDKVMQVFCKNMAGILLHFAC